MANSGGMLCNHGSNRRNLPSPFATTGREKLATRSLGAVRPKNFKCPNCDKSYIGQAGLARHFRLNPDHCANPSEDGSASSLHNGSLDGDDNSKDTPLPQDGSLLRLSDSALDTTATPGGPNSGSTNLETFSEDSNTQDSLNSTEAPSPHTVLGPSSHRGRGRGRFRGRWAHLKYNAHMRRKNKLKEFIKQCNDEELMEVVLPRLVTSISLWEFLMMKSEKGGARPQVDVMYHEFELLSKHVRQACASYLQPLSQQELEDDSLQCKMIKVSDKKLGICLDLEPVTYRVREMPSGDCNTFSSLHNKLSAAAIASSQQEADSVRLSKPLEPERVELRINGGQKRPLESVLSGDDELHNASKRPRISTLPIPTAGSTGLFTVKAHLPSEVTCVEGEGNQETLPSDPSELFSCSPHVSPSNLATIRVIAPSQDGVATSSSSNSVSLLSSSVSTPSSSSSLPLLTKAITTSAGSSAQTAHVHISCPSTHQQTGHNTHVLNCNPTFTTPLSLAHNLLINTMNSKQAKPQVMAVAAGGLHTGQAVCSNTTRTTASTLPPLIANSGVGLGTQRFVLAGPGAQTILAQQGAGPGTALLLAAGAAAGNHRILVRHPPPTVASTQKQLKQSKVHNQAASTVFSSLLASSAAANPTTAVTKPTEVKVSRQLFHNATQSSTSSLLGSSKTVSLLTNGKAPASNVIVSTPSVDPPQTPATVSHVLNSYVLEGAQVVNSQVAASREILQTVKAASHPDKSNSKGTSNKTLETPPSGHQFVTSPNKAASTSNHVGMGVVIGAPTISDIDVMGLELPVVDDINSGLGPTPTDSFNDSFASTSSSVVTTMVAGSHFLNHSQGGSVTDSILSYHKPNGDILVMSNSNPSLTSTASGPSNHSSSSSSSSSYSLPNQNVAAVSRLHENHKPAIFSNNKVNVKQVVTENIVSTNGPVFSQPIKSNNTSLDTNLSALQFSNHADLPPESTPDQFTNGNVIPTEDSPDISCELENVDTALPEEIPLSNQLEEQMDQEGISNNTEALVSTESSQQLLLSEGTNIYQTEDGIFIQSSNGNTYQLQGAQGLSLEAVQALLSGTLDQLAS
ncbi:zinc finger protein 839-like [Elysia marginata]|uniref:Zinc finger protein 839-like n=1 Tax=Elysia marginata TaxID=1093978 RepID=A0AAV4F577_9GAST|nr:zinc finger protein 839-like [Elysia marginata]